MKVGLGFDELELFTDDTLSFAKQIGVSHVMVHVPDRSVMPHTDEGYWTREDLGALVRRIESHGMRLESLENFAPEHWYEVLLATSGREKQMDNLKRTIENVGRAGIPIIGFNFSIAAVTGRKLLPMSRGGARAPVFELENSIDFHKPAPLGYAWGRQIIDPPPPGDQGFVSEAEMWERLDYFLERALPVAEEFGVTLAAHPEDPPVPVMRQISRLLISAERFDELFRRHPSKRCQMQFCQGTFTEMPYGENYVYDSIDHFTKLDRVAYVHLRNVRGKLPNYYEDFIDCGDIDMMRAMKIYQDNGFTGMFIPDHVPFPSVGEPWIAGVAYTIGYMRALMTAMGIEIEE